MRSFGPTEMTPKCLLKIFAAALYLDLRSLIILAWPHRVAIAAVVCAIALIVGPDWPLRRSCRISENAGVPSPRGSMDATSEPPLSMPVGWGFSFDSNRTTTNERLRFTPSFCSPGRPQLIECSLLPMPNGSRRFVGNA